MSITGLLMTTETELRTAKARVEELERTISAIAMECSTGLCAFDKMNKHHSLNKVRDKCGEMGYGILGEKLETDGESNE